MSHSYLKLYLHLPPLVRPLEVKEREETKSMQKEEDVTRAFKTKEKEFMKMEISRMETEELELQPCIRWEASFSRENIAVLQQVKEAELRSHAILNTKEKKSTLQQQANMEALQALEVIGNVKFRRFRLAKLTRACRKRMEMNYVENSLMETEKKAVSKFLLERNEFSLMTEIDTFYHSHLLHQVIHDIVQETQKDHIKSIEIEELVCSIVPSQESSSQIAFKNLQFLRSHRMKQQEMLCDIWKHQSIKLKQAENEFERRKEMDRIRKERREKIKLLCREMKVHEMQSRIFYRAELALTLSERRNMKMCEVL